MEINTWTEKGVPYAEIRARLAERTDVECSTAALFLIDHVNIPEITLNQLVFAADKERNSLKILDQVDPIFRRQLAINAPDMPEQTRNFCLELHALMVEHYVRAANQCSPLGKPN